MNSHDLPEGFDMTKGFKMTEIGPLPEEWEVVALGSLGKVSAGGSAPQGSKYFEGDKPFVRVQHLEEAGYEVRRWDLITDNAVRRYRLRLYPAGTIVFPKSGASIRLEKRAVLRRPSYLVSHLCALIPDGDVVDGDFLFFALRAIRFASEKAEAYPTLSLSEIRGRLLPRPPLPEQLAIAHVLRTVQRAKEATERVLAAMYELKKSLMRHLFTYGPVPLDQVEQVRLKETEIGPVPEGWEVVRLERLFHPLDDATERIVQIKNDDEYKLIVTRLYAKGVSLRETRRGAGISSKSMYQVKQGDFIFSKIGIRKGAFGFIPHELEGAVVTSEHPILRLDERKADEFYISYRLSLPEIWEKFKTESKGFSGRERLKVREFLSFSIPLPPFFEQLVIAEILRTVDRKIQAEQRRKAALDALFKTLLHNLMTGKVRAVKDSNGHDDL